MAARSTLSTAAEVTSQRTVALLPAASQSVAQKEVEVINEADGLCFESNEPMTINY